MAIRLGINGFGRIGRQALRVAATSGSGIRVVAINDLADTRTLAHLLRYDSVHGRYPGTVEEIPNGLRIDGRDIEVTAEPNPTKLPWARLNVDMVLECTGRFTKKGAARAHLAAGAPRVLVSAPADGVDATIVMGVNDHVLSHEHEVVSAASCTTNCLAPLAKVLNDAFGLRSGLMTTIHAYTNDQAVLDAPHRDLRRARAASVSMIPTTTGAAKAVGLVLPELDGKLNGMAVRVPVPDGSLVDLVAHLDRPASRAEINAALISAANGRMQGILATTDDPIVGCDIIGHTASSIIDLTCTTTVGEDMVKIVSWYDNEVGYANRCVDLIRTMACLRSSRAAA